MTQVSYGHQHGEPAMLPVDLSEIPMRWICSFTSLENIRQSVDKGSVVGAVFLDLKKAFDTTNHNIFYLSIKLRPGTDLQIYADTVVHVSGKNLWLFVFPLKSWPQQNLWMLINMLMLNVRIKGELIDQQTEVKYWGISLESQLNLKCWKGL